MSISRIHRLLKLITMLQGSRRYTAGELAREMEVSKRTIFRDLNMLELAGIPYYFDPEQHGYAISKNFFLPAINLTLQEALAMLLLTGQAGRAKGPGRDVPLLGAAAQAAMKLESALPAGVRSHVGSVLGHISVSGGPTARHAGLEGMFETLTEAIGRRSVCRMVYLSFFERQQMRLTVRPLRLVFMSRAWYLIAYSVRHREIRTFKLSRIRQVEATVQLFDEPRDVDLDKYFGQAWSMIPEGKIYNVHLWFAPKVAGNVAEVHWHASQRVHFNDDGSADIHFHIDGLGEITWWILGYGDQVEVRSPALLRKRVAAVAANMCKTYRKGPKA